MQTADNQAIDVSLSLYSFVNDNMKLHFAPSKQTSTSNPFLCAADFYLTHTSSYVAVW